MDVNERAELEFRTMQEEQYARNQAEYHRNQEEEYQYSMEAAIEVRGQYIRMYSSARRVLQKHNCMYKPAHACAAAHLLVP